MTDWNHAYLSQDGDEVVCSNCGYIVGYDEEHEIEFCPKCKAEFVLFPEDEEEKTND